ncbi:MAG: Fic family protein [Saprospiraceae bacterium]
MAYQLLPLPPQTDLETKEILRKVASTHRFLAELKGVAATIPNENILISTLVLQEAKDSSAIENIITTDDELFRAELFAELVGPAQKEVQNYARALRYGFDKTRQHGLLTNNLLLEIQEILEENRAGFRKLPGTNLKNQQTGEVVYTPPQDYDSIVALMNNLEKMINDDEAWPVDPLIKMAALHFQFESIHPFYDGNGRTGRILNILYLVNKDLLRLPILYLSRYVIRHKSDYYRLLQGVRDHGDWQSWIIYMLDGVETTARETIATVTNIKNLMQDYKHRIRAQLPKIYSQDLLNNLFRHPYTKIEFVMQDLQVGRITATRYLDRLQEAGFLEKQKIGRSNFYLNRPLLQLFLSGA